MMRSELALAFRAHAYALTSNYTDVQYARRGALALVARLESAEPMNAAFLSRVRGQLRWLEDFRARVATGERLAA